MRHTIKFFLTCAIFILSLISLSSTAVAQGLWDFPELSKSAQGIAFNAASSVNAFPCQSIKFGAFVGNSYQDFQYPFNWHDCGIDLYKPFKDAVYNFDGISAKSDWYITKADSIDLNDARFSFDQTDSVRARPGEFTGKPYLFPIGARYAQIFKCYRYLFLAEYSASGGAVSVMDLLLMDANDRMPGDPLYNPPNPAEIFETDPDVIKAYWLEQGADPNSFDPNHPSYLKPDSGISAAMGREFIIYPSAPIFAREDFRFNASGTPGDPDNPMYPNPAFVNFIPTSGINLPLEWNGSTNGLGSYGQLIPPLEINPVDGMPTYIPVYRNAADVSAVYGAPFWGPDVVTAFEGALYNAGFTFWPNIAVIDFTPQAFEDIILTIWVGSWPEYAYETFPISVANYPIENYPPYIIEAFDKICYLGEKFEYQMTAIDPDCFIFSLCPSDEDPRYAHLPMISGNKIRDDMDYLSYDFYIYVNGILANELITGCPINAWCGVTSELMRGLLSCTPKYSYNFDVKVVCIDKHGGPGYADFTINCLYPPGNHPPAIIKCPESLLTAWAGQEIVLSSSDIKVTDPDGDTLYASSNIGYIYQNTEYGFMNWTLLTHFPGIYNVEIIFSDRRSGYAKMEFKVDVRPWWAD
ncbi:hypothetical protein JXL19_07720 [bacterium]|nr:hypothetical protein [bacterium]